MATGVLSLVFRCIPTRTEEPRPTEESRDARWFSLEQVERAKTEAFCIRVRDALSRAPAVVRTLTVTDLMAPKPAATSTLAARVQDQREAELGS